MSPRGRTRQPPDGELRRSQVITTFGPGAMIDLPEHSIIVGGLDHWYGRDMSGLRIFEDRLEARVAQQLDQGSIELRSPPVDPDEPGAPRTGIAAFLFPTWFLGQVIQEYRTKGGKIYRTRPLMPYNRLVKGGYLDENRKVKPVVPVRFVQACVKGHISDIDWYAFVRNDFKTERKGQLWLDEGGAGNDFSEIYVRDEVTGKRRPLSKAMVRGKGPLGKCPGRMPWMGPRAHEPCGEPNRLLTRSASNAYFGQTLSAISIPDKDEKVREAVNLVYDGKLSAATSMEVLKAFRMMPDISNVLGDLTDEEVWAELERRRSPVAAASKGIKQAEIETMLVQQESVGEDIPGGDFYARARALEGIPGWLADKVERVVLVHRLREVTAQVGFTRFEPPVPDVDGELTLDVELASLARDVTWVPAVENRGEGVFVAFKEEAIEAWLKRPAVQERGKSLVAGFDAWKQRRGVEDAKFPGLPYIMLHTLSHLMITAVSLDCGYSATAIKERVYAGDSGYGILLYTGTPGSEGTLGGLVQVGQVIEQHLQRAVEAGRLCSADPVCAQHEPANMHEERFLHGAACHACVLVAETSCERRNEVLDRALVTSTVEALGAEMFNLEE